MGLITMMEKTGGGGVVGSSWRRVSDLRDGKRLGCGWGREIARPCNHTLWKGKNLWNETDGTSRWNCLSHVTFVDLNFSNCKEGCYVPLTSIPSSKEGVLLRSGAYTLHTPFSAPRPTATPTASGLSVLVPHVPTSSLVPLLSLQAHVKSAH